MSANQLLQIFVAVQETRKYMLLSLNINNNDARCITRVAPLTSIITSTPIHVGHFVSPILLVLLVAAQRLMNASNSITCGTASFSKSLAVTALPTFISWLSDLIKLAVRIAISISCCGVTDFNPRSTRFTCHRSFPEIAILCFIL